MRVGLTLTLLLVVTACGPAPIVNPDVPDTGPVPVLEQHEPDGCGATGLLGLVGHPQADIATAVAASARPVRHRVLAFGTLVTQEYDAGRVNFLLDPAGLVASVRCG
jgi:hypothetical protein